MATTIYMDSTAYSFDYVYRATSGGTVFSANLAGQTAYDYFDDSAVVDDCIYFAESRRSGVTNPKFNVATPISATSITLVWEYYNRDGTWHEIEDLQDDTEGFTVTGENQVKFPLQWEPDKITINGQFQFWFRCRISAVSGITEGGANQSIVPQFQNGMLWVTGTTEEDPASFEEVYQWLITNEPHISVRKIGDNVYDFTKIGIRTYTELLTKNEVIILGQNIVWSSTSESQNIFGKLISGELVDGRGVNGSVFIIYGLNNSNVCQFEPTTKCYGTTFRTGPDQAFYGATPGYANLYGEFVDCWLELAVRPPNASYPDAYASNCQITNGLMIVGSEILEGQFDDIHIIQVGSYIFYVYTSSFTMKNTSWVSKYSNRYIFYTYQASGDYDQEWVMLNPKQEMPTLDSTGNFYPVRITSSNGTMTACRFYSGGSYTDYTTEIQNFTADDVPLTGEVGDCILFGNSPTIAIVANGWGLNTTITSQLNDYTYVWEYYDGSDWQPVDPNRIKDGTFNFTQSGVIMLGIPIATPASVIDGTNAIWCRARITAKGTESPSMTHSYQYRSGGNSNWKAMEKYTFNLEVRDEAGDAIVGATVTATDEDGDEIFSVETDENGQIAEQRVLAKEWYLDVTEAGLIAERVYSTFEVRIYSVGYLSAVMEDLDVVGEKDLTVYLGRPRMLGQGRIS